MSMSRRSVLGVFDDAGTANKAIDALQDAGFSRDQIHSSRSGNSGGFLSGLKSMFTGEPTETAGSARDLTDTANISDEEANYYEQEHEAGRTIVVVQPGERKQDAMAIMRQMGAYDYGSRDIGTRGGCTMDATGSPAGTMQSGSQRGGMMDTNTTADTTRTADRRDPALNPADTMRTAGSDETNRARATGARGMGDQDATSARGTRDIDSLDADDARKMKLREEQLGVTKERVQTGEVGIRKEIVTEEKTITVPVTHEEVYIERHAISGEGGDVTTPLGEGESIRVPVSEERVSVNKDTVVTGEVSIGKRAVEGTQQVTDTVRHEEARVGQKGDTPIRDGLQDDRRSDTWADDASHRDPSDVIDEK